MKTIKTITIYNIHNNYKERLELVILIDIHNDVVVH